ncbi:hypothetical protein CGCSCA5_v008837 [Colletotrichum siamense]|nr:hypothetical protein CGCSCA5_v008837 [Colletotrichum siamense]
MRFSFLLPLFATAALAADQGKGCDVQDAIDCSGDNVVKCYVFAGNTGMTWNFETSCPDQGQVCNTGNCQTVAMQADQGKDCGYKDAFGCSGNNIVQCNVFPGRDKMTWNFFESCADKGQVCAGNVCQTC